MTPPRTMPLLVTSLAMVIASACSTGCEPWDPWANKDGHAVVIAPFNSISVYQLAGRLGMTVANADERTATLRTRGPETVLISTGLLGHSVHLNGKRLALEGDVLAVDGVLFVPESFESAIREAMPHAPVPPPVGPVAPNRPAAPAPRPVVIDAGHGGNDPGAPGIVGVPEKQINLAVAMKAADLLRQRGVPVVLTRESDTFIELDERANISNRIRASLLVSVHADSFNSPDAKGFTVFVAEKADDRAMGFGQTVAKHLAAAGVTDRGVRRRDLRVLVRSTCPAVLVELGFLTNPSEAKALTTAGYQDMLARALAEAVVETLARSETSR